LSSTSRRTGAGDVSISESRAEAYPIEQDPWLLFAGLMILFTGIWNLIEGFVASFRSAYFIGSPVFGSLWIWALAWMGIGLLELAAGAGILAGRTWARWFGIAVVGVSAIADMLAIGTYPWWALFVLSVDVVILYALTVRWRRRAALVKG
jgi:hypothetical protein